VATVSEKAQHGYADADEFIQYQIEQARNRIKATDLLTASVLAGLLLVVYVLMFTLFDHWVVDGGFSPWTRAIMLLVVLLLCGAILFRYVLRPWFRRIHPLYAARMLDRSSEGLEGSLLALVDLQSGGRRTDTPIQRTLEKRAAVKLTEVHVDEAIDRRLLIRLGTALFVVTLITCLYAVLSPKSISLLRPLTLARTSVATRTVVESVQPGNKTVPAGSQVEFIADLSGVIPEEVQVLYTTVDRRFVDEPLKMRATDDQNRFRVLMVGEGDRGIRQNLQYRITAGDATSDVYTISVDQPPTARVTGLRYKYPAYMNLPERVDSSGTIEAWEDTVVTISAESSVPVETAMLQFSDDAAFSVRGEEVPMSIRDKALSVEIKLEDREDGSFPKFYRIQVTDADGAYDPEPVVYAVEVRKDQPPIVKLLDPTRDLQVAANAIVPLLIEAEDPDFLLRSVTLHYSINGKLIQPSEVLLDTSKTALPNRWADSWDFRLSLLKLNPGDVVTYHVEARDNRPPLGNQSRTGDLNLQITAPISEQAVQDQLAQDRQMQEQQLKDRQAPGNSAGEQSEQPGTEEQAESPMPADNESPKDQQPEASSEKPAKDGQDQSDPSGSGAEQKQPAGTTPKNSDAAERGDGDPSAQQRGPGDQSAKDRSGQQRADDDEAMQRVIEKMNRDGRSNDDQNTNPAASERTPGDLTNQDSGDSTKQDKSRTQNPKEPAGSEKSEDTPSGAKEEPTEDAGQPDEKSSETAGSDKPTNASDTPLDTNSTNGRKPDPEKTTQESPEDSQSDAEKSGAEKSGDEKSGGEKSGSEKSGSEKSGDEKSGDEKSGDEKSGGEKSGGEKSGGEKSGGEKSGGEKSGSEKSGGEKSGSEKSGGEKSGSEKSGGEKSGGEKSGGEKSGGEKSGGEKSGGEKSGGEKSGGEKSGGEKSGGEKSGGEKSGGEKSGGEKSGGEKSGGEKSGGEKSGGEKSGGEESGGEQSSSSEEPGERGDSSSSQKAGGRVGSGAGRPNPGGSGQESDEPGGGGPGQESKARPNDPQVDDAAKAAGLALRRLQKDLERGEVDPKLLEQLGWTKDELKSFVDRMQKQLEERELNDQQQRERSLSQKSFEEMLRSLDVESTGKTREGSSAKDRDQQDTTGRQSTPPGRYRQQYEMYQRSVSGVKGDPEKK